MATSTCTACNADAFVADGSGGGICSRCGYASGEGNRCPHCGAVARIEGSGLAAVCAICGGPRVPSNLGGDDTANALREQKTALSNARTASVATVVQAVFAAFATLIGLGLAPESILGKALVVVLAAVPLFLAMRSRGRATKARSQARDAADRAWRGAAEDAASRSKEGVTVPGLAKALGIEKAHADKLLTELTVHDRTRIDVGDDAEVRYSAAPGPRIGVPEAQVREERELIDEPKGSEREGLKR